MTLNLKNTISVIVPVYKAEKYIERCIESILAQNYKDIEVILVDDNSPDKCPKICDEYAAKYENIHAIHLKDTAFGASDARNEGLKVSTGEYIAFIDSDDYVHPELFSTLMKPIQDDIKIKMSICSYEKVIDHKIIVDDTDNCNYNIINVPKALELIIKDQTQSALWGKIFSKKLFENLKFKSGKHNEDMFIMPNLIDRAVYIAYTQRTLYYYFQDNESLCRSTFNYHMLDMIEALDEWKSYIKNNQPELMELIEARYFSTLLDMSQYLVIKEDEIYRIKYLKYNEELKSNKVKIIKSKHFSLSNKIKIILIEMYAFNFIIKMLNLLKIKNYN